MKGPQATGYPGTAAEMPDTSSDAPESAGSGVVVGRPEGALPIGARDPRD